MRIDLRYISRFTYYGTVRESHNALRACPATTGFQRLGTYRVRVEPAAQVLSFTDYWGTRVDTFGVDVDHTELSIIADASVTTGAAGEPTSDVAWRGPFAIDDHMAHFEYLAPSPHVRWGDEVGAFAAAAVTGSGSLLEAVTRVEEAVGTWMTYEPGVTEVGTPVDDVFVARRGVCQDYAHLAVAFYRSLGIPARYVSGYFYSDDTAVGTAPTTSEIVVQTHAWVEVFVDGHGWWALDPTNRVPVGERHVKIGHGRDYEDVTPLRGVHHGQQVDAELGVSVTMSRHPVGGPPSGFSAPRIGASRSDGSTVGGAHPGMQQ